MICTKAIGRELRAFVYNKSDFHLEMFDGGMHGTELRVPSSSLLLVFVAFIVLTIISMIWLIFYYVQRFRYHHHQDRVIVSISFHSLSFISGFLIGRWVPGETMSGLKSSKIQFPFVVLIFSFKPPSFIHDFSRSLAIIYICTHFALLPFNISPVNGELGLNYT